MSDLLTTVEAAERLGVTAGSFSNSIRGWGLVSAGKRGTVRLYRPADIQALVEKRAATKRTQRVRAPLTAEQANAKVERDLARDQERAEAKSHGWGHGRADHGPNEPRLKAVVYEAWLAGTLGPRSPFAETEPPPSYRAAFERFAEPVKA